MMAHQRIRLISDLSRTSIYTHLSLGRGGGKLRSGGVESNCEKLRTSIFPPPCPGKAKLSSEVV